MSRIRITVAAGSSAGQQLIFEQERVTFGRAADNDVVIDLDAVSREHGELVFENGRWWLHNHSSNPTKLGKRRVKSKPRPVTGFQSIDVGGLPLLKVEANPAPQPAADEAEHDDEDASPQADAGSRRMGKAKVWGGIAAFWVVLLALVALLTTLETGGGTDTGLERLTERQIDNEIEAPIPSEPENERRMNALLVEARRYFSLIDSDRGALYEAYRHYRQAKAHAP
ncbi:MAG: FHA domain-containing protein, partial [Phycisphaeraceae bacterium]